MMQMLLHNSHYILVNLQSYYSMLYINQEQLLQMSPRYRVQVMNSLSGFKSAHIIGRHYTLTQR